MKHFVVDVADLVHRPGARRTDRLSGPTAGMHVAETLVAPGSTLSVEVRFEPVGAGILATGTASVDWTSECRRCAVPVSGTVHAAFQEAFEEGADPEADVYPMRQDQVDVELVSREAILLDLPLAPLCRVDCAGLCITCGADLNDQACSCGSSTSDPRWAALDALSFGQQDVENPAENSAEEG
jgi:uncharacterized protein